MAHEHHHHRYTGSDLAEVLDLDAEVLRDHLAAIADWTQAHAGPSVRRIVDLGSGTGVGTFALLERFPAGTVTAVDLSAEMHQRLTEKARHRGLADRVDTVVADLDDGWPAIADADLIWATNSLHHVADPDRVLADALVALNPGGLLALVEMKEFPRFLPDPAGRAVEERCHAARADTLPALGADWAPALAKAGFTVEATRTFRAELTAPLPPAATRYAYASLERFRHGLADRLDPADLSTLDDILTGLPQRSDLTVRTARTAWLARRPD